MISVCVCVISVEIVTDVRGVVQSVKITDPRTEPCGAQCEITTGMEETF